MENIGVNVFELCGENLILKEANEGSLVISEMDKTAIGCEIREIYPIVEGTLFDLHVTTAKYGYCKAAKCVEYNGHILDIDYLPIGKNLMAVKFQPVEDLLHLIANFESAVNNWDVSRIAQLRAYYQVLKQKIRA